jgi:serine/threonine protein kinase
MFTVCLTYRNAIPGLMKTNACNSIPLDVIISSQVMIAMELCERGALRECLQLYSRESNWELIVRLGMDIAQGLHFLHERGIVHRYALHMDCMSIYKGIPRIL